MLLPHKAWKCNVHFMIDNILNICDTFRFRCCRDQDECIMWNSKVIYGSLTHLICLIKWMTTIFIMLKMNNYNGDHMHENSLLLFCSCFKNQSSIKAINKLWLQMVRIFSHPNNGVWTLSRLQRHCLIWKSITQCKVTAREYISTQFAKNENSLPLLFSFKSYRTNPQIGQEKSDMNWMIKDWNTFNPSLNMIPVIGWLILKMNTH